MATATSASSSEPFHFDSRALDTAHALRKISMLDVFVMGVVVVCLAGNAYKDKGIQFVMLPGLLLLLCAEVLHYVLYYLVSGIAECMFSPEAYDAKEVSIR